ncbi:MAG: phytanoyl-CoA dioxygenase family protein [Acidimicrobiales bacterium]
MALMQVSAGVEEVLGAIRQDGYAVVEGVLDAGELAVARDELYRILRSTPQGRNAFEGFGTQRIYALFAKTRAFDRAATDALVLGVMAGLIGDAFQLSGATGIHIGPGEVAQVLHYDDAIYPLPRPHPDVVASSLWAIDDFTDANGATRVIPGSHRWVAEQACAETVTLPAEMPAGSVLFYPGSFWHGGGANATAEPRLGVLLNYVASWIRPQENHLLAVPRSTVATLPERLGELLGYNICPPFIGYVDGRHPRRVLTGADD